MIEADDTVSDNGISNFPVEPSARSHKPHVGKKRVTSDRSVKNTAPNSHKEKLAKSANVRNRRVDGGVG